MPTQGFEFAFNLDGSNQPPVAYDIPVADANARVGDLVVLSSGQATRAAAGLTEVLGVCAESFAGAVAGDLRKIYIIQPGQVWRCSADAATQAGDLGVKTINVVDHNTIDATPSTGGTLILVGTQGLDSAGNVITLVAFSNIAFGHTS